MSLAESTKIRILNTALHEYAATGRFPCAFSLNVANVDQYNDLKDVILRAINQVEKALLETRKEG